MKVECSHCNKVYNIPDERLTMKKKISFPCPSCKGIIELDLSEKADKKEEVEQSSDKIDSETLKVKILKKLKDLAPMPQVVSKAREIMADPNTSFKDIGKVLETDQAITARILKMANSAYYGLSGTVSSIHQASVVLGFETLGEVITVAGASKLLGKTLKGYRMKSGFLWRHSIAVAIGSKLLASKRNPKLENDAFSAGLIHDSGMLALDPYIFQNKASFEDVMKDGVTTYLSAEKEIFGFDHAEIAYELCKKWKIPDLQADAIRYHHHPSESDGNELSYIIYMADAMAKIGGFVVDIGDMRYQPDEEVKAFLSLDDDEINQCITEVSENVENISQII